MPRLRHEGGKLMDCPICETPDILFYPGEDFEEDGEVYHEPDAYGCPECGHMEVL